MENQQQESQPIPRPRPGSAEGGQSQPPENLQPSPHKPDKKLVAVVIAIAVLLLATVAIGAYYWWQSLGGSRQHACTMEAKLCPDGSAVGRVGPNCEFAPCPSGGTQNCQNLCGDGVCQEVVCMMVGCPCAETVESCQQDCASKTACAKESAMCGGIAGIQCCSGLTCQLQGNYPDASGACISEQTKDWQTYRNEEYGFEVKLPADLTMQKGSTTEPEISWDGKLNSIPYILTSGYIFQNALNTMGITYCGAYPEDARCENHKWDNLSAIIDWNIETEGAFTKSRAEIQHPNGGVVIISIYHRPTQDIEPFFRQILSTFKFIK